MASPELRDIMSGPEYVGPVLGVKSEYHVYRTAKRDFVVFTKSNRGKTSFHVTFVAETRVEALKELVPEDGTTSGALLKDARVAEIFREDDRDALYFEVLTTLYILAALSFVEITKSGRNLLFTPKGPVIPEPQAEVVGAEMPAEPESPAERPSARKRQRRR
jgi:hypothetical protein